MSGLWERLLRDSSQNKRYQDGNLVILGCAKSGSKSLISSLQSGPGSLGKNTIYSQLLSPEDTSPQISPLQYTYLNAKDPSDPQSDRLSKINIFKLEQPELKSLLELGINPKSLGRTLLAIVLDWEQPWKLMQDLEMWIDIWHEVLGKIVSTLPLETQDELIKAVNDYVKSYKDPENFSETNNVEDLPLPEGVLQVNLGVPVVVICNKSDLVWTIDKNRDQNEKILDSALKELREFCVMYGASLIYTSSKNGTNIPTLYEYLMHRLYGFSFKIRPQILVRDQIFIPSGWDSPSLIRETDCLAGEKQFKDLIPKPKNKFNFKDSVSAVSDQDFLVQVKEKIESAKKSKREGVINMLQRTSVSADSGPNNENTQNEAPKTNKLEDFYKMLLKNGNKEVYDN